MTRYLKRALCNLTINYCNLFTMASTVWGTSADGTIEYRSLTAEYLKDALYVMNNSFYLHENVCKAVKLPENKKAILELEELTLRAARDGLSIIAVDKLKNKVAGVSFNKLQQKANAGDSFFEDFARACKYDESRGVVQFMIDADSCYDLFEHCNVDCLIELMFVTTLPEYRGKGIGKQLCETSIAVARRVANGENVKQSIDGSEMALEPRPKIVSAIFTSFISQKIGRQLGFEIAARMGWENFKHLGKGLIVEKETPDTTLEYIKF